MVKIGLLNQKYYLEVSVRFMYVTLQLIIIGNRVFPF